MTEVTDEFGALLTRLLRKIMLILQGRKALVAVLRPDGSQLIPARAAFGLDAEQLAAIDTERLRAFSQFALTARTPTTLNSSGECSSALGDTMGGAISNGLCVPLLAQPGDTQPIAGLLFLFNKATGDAFSAEDRSLSIVLSRQLAAVLFEQQRRAPMV